jgi:hypothetical protein
MARRMNFSRSTAARRIQQQDSTRAFVDRLMEEAEVVYKARRKAAKKATGEKPKGKP